MKKDRRCQCKECLNHLHSKVAKEHRLLIRWLSGLDERCRRQFVGFWAYEYGYGGVSLASKITGYSPHTIRRGLFEMQHPSYDEAANIRHSGAGRKRLEKKDRQSSPLSLSF